MVSVILNTLIACVGVHCRPDPHGADFTSLADCKKYRSYFLAAPPRPGQPVYLCIQTPMTVETTSPLAGGRPATFQTETLPQDRFASLRHQATLRPDRDAAGLNAPCADGLPTPVRRDAWRSGAWREPPPPSCLVVGAGDDEIRRSRRARLTGSPGRGAADGGADDPTARHHRGLLRPPWSWDEREEPGRVPRARTATASTSTRPRPTPSCASAGGRTIRRTRPSRAEAPGRGCAASSACASAWASARSRSIATSTTRPRRRWRASSPSSTTLGVDDLAILFDDMRGDQPDLAADAGRDRALDRRAHRRRAPDRLPDLSTPTIRARPRSSARAPPDYLEDSRRGPRSGDRGLLDRRGGLLARVQPRPPRRASASSCGASPSLWDNYPVNDGPGMSPLLHLRAFTGRPAAIGAAPGRPRGEPGLQPVLFRIPALTLAESYAPGDGLRIRAGVRPRRRGRCWAPDLAALVRRHLPPLPRPGPRPHRRADPAAAARALRRHRPPRRHGSRRLARRRTGGHPRDDGRGVGQVRPATALRCPHLALRPAAAFEPDAGGGDVPPAVGRADWDRSETAHRPMMRASCTSPNSAFARPSWSVRITQFYSREILLIREACVDARLDCSQISLWRSR